MNIQCSNINDFCELITLASKQNIKAQTIFASSKSSYPSIAFENSHKDHQTFTYAFFTPLYTAIYTGKIKANVFNEEYNLLKDTCSKFGLYIYSFEKLNVNFEKNTLYLETYADMD